MVIYYGGRRLIVFEWFYATSGPSAETVYRTADLPEVSGCGEKNNGSNARQAEQRPALSGSVDVHKSPLPEESKSLSKNALKKLAKQERMRQVKLQNRAHEKELRHKETERKRREWQEKLANLPEEEVKKAQEARMELRASRKDERKARKDKLVQAMTDGQNIVIDLEFGEKMKLNEVSSLCQQVCYCTLSCLRLFCKHYALR